MSVDLKKIIINHYEWCLSQDSEPDINSESMHLAREVEKAIREEQADEISFVRREYEDENNKLRSEIETLKVMLLESITRKAYPLAHIDSDGTGKACSAFCLACRIRALFDQE